MDDNGTYLENIYGIYKECITNISIDNQTHRHPMGRPPHWGAADEGGGACVSD